MYQKTFYATHPESIYGATNDDLRELYQVEGLFAAGEIRLNYSHFDRIVVGGAVPTGEKLSLPEMNEPESLKGTPFLRMRELGADAEREGVKFDTSLRGNGNRGHMYGAELPESAKLALLEYLKTL
jgi:hypothetical protein